MKPSSNWDRDKSKFESGTRHNCLGTLPVAFCGCLSGIIPRGTSVAKHFIVHNATSTFRVGDSARKCIRCGSNDDDKRSPACTPG